MTATDTSPAAPSITAEKIGRRTYITGNTFLHKSALQNAGCTWDGDRRAWWTGKADVAARLVSELNATPVAAGPLRGAPTKLRSGDWGVRVFSTDVKAGATVNVFARSSGKRWDAIVDSIERVDGDTTICSTRKAPATTAARPSGTTHRHGGRCREHGCSAPAVREGYCKQCFFDEFDC